MLNPQTCHFCGKETWIYNHPIRRYTCKPKDTYQECEAFKLIDHHLRTCERCKPIFDKLDLSERYAYLRYKCEQFKYLFKKVKGTETESSKIRAYVEAGLLKCEICGRPARFAVYGNKPCCEDRSTKCPGHHEYISKVMIKKYKDNPELLINMSKKLKVSQNKPEVKELKSNAMIRLHRGDCDECKEFQHNFKTAHKARRKNG